MRASADGKATVEAGLDTIYRCADATWFEWPKGLALLFWNRAQEYQSKVRDRQPHFMMGNLETPFFRKQTKARDPGQHELMQAKVVQVQQRGYIKNGVVASGTHYFCMPKGTPDIRMVYNRTSCGLNACLYAPRYGLIQVKHTLWALREGYYQCNLDVRKQFLNYKLHNGLQQLSGVDICEVRRRTQQTGHGSLAGPEVGSIGNATGWGCGTPHTAASSGRRDSRLKSMATAGSRPTHSIGIGWY